jgi:hypothetical protein
MINNNNNIIIVSPHLDENSISLNDIIENNYIITFDIFRWMSHSFM